MNKRFSKFMLTSASALALLAAYPSVASTAEVVGFDLPAITAQAATQGDAFIRVVRALPSVSNIKASDASSVRAARNLYNSLPAAEKANAGVVRWAGFLAEKEAALPVDHVRDFLLESRALPNVAEINAMNAKEFAQAKVDLQAARSSYAKLTDAQKARTDVARWAGYLTVKEDAFGVTFILAAKDLPSMDAIGKLDAKELVAVQEDIDSVRELYDALSDVAKADKEVARWIGYVDQKEEAVEEASVVELAIDSTRAINAKTIEVTFNTEVEDTSKATVELLRGTFKQNSTVTWANDKKSVTLEVPGQLQTAEYTVNISGLDDKVLTGSVKVEAQKVASIEILDDLAVLSSDSTKATVTFTVKDQYGVDITKDSRFKVEPGDKETQAVVGNTVVITDTNLKVNNKVAIVLIDRATGTTETKTVTISNASAVTDIAFKGIFDDKGKEVALNEDLTSGYFLVLDLKDQYGNKVTDEATVEKMLVTNTNTGLLTLGKNPTVKTIDGKAEAVIEVSLNNKAGATKAIVISSTNGKTAEYDITVAETVRTDAVSLSQPELALEGQSILVPLSVLDKEGKPVVDKNILENEVKGLKQISPQGSKLVVKDGKTFVEITGKKSGDYVTVLVQSSTLKTDTVTFRVEDKAVATIITGVKSPLVVKGTKELKASDLIVKDQYGKDVKAEDIGEFTVTKVNADSKVLDVNGKEIKGISNGKDKVRIQLVGKADSAIEVEVQVTDGKEYTSYVAKDLGLLDAKENNKLVVSGVLPNGGTVVLEGTDYTATTNIEGTKVEKGVLTVEDSVFTVDGKPVAVRDIKVTFIINNDGSKLEKTYKVSNAASVTEDFFFTSSDTKENAVVINELEHKGNAAFSLADIKVVTTDQYGSKEFVAGSDLPIESTVTIVPADASKVKINGNGTNGASVELINNEEVKEATVTFNVTTGNATKSITVKLTR